MINCLFVWADTTNRTSITQQREPTSLACRAWGQWDVPIHPCTVHRWRRTRTCMVCACNISFALCCYQILWMNSYDAIRLAGPTGYNPSEYQYSTNQNYYGKPCSPDENPTTTARDERSASTSPSSPDSCVNPAYANVPAPPLTHPPAHGYQVSPAGYLSNGGLSSGYGYPQAAYCGVYPSPTDNLHTRGEHCIRSTYGW